ncbi:MAG TPA: histidinol dehydrogenase [Humisphaera sp.]
MIPTLRLADAADRARAQSLLDRLRLKPADVVLGQQQDVAAVTAILADVAARGDDAIVDSARKFDDPNFSADQIKVRPDEMAAAHARIGADQLSALRRSIAQVREYQQHILPTDPSPLRRPGVELGLRYTPLDSAGCYFPGGKAAYPSSLIMLSVPAQVAGVKRVVVCTPPSKFGKSDLVLAACHELKLTDVYRAGGAAAIAAMAFGTKTIPAVDKIVGPGNRYVQLAKRALAGVVGVDGFLGPSEIVVIADDSANPAFIAADLIAQAEHDPGSCFLLTDSETLAAAVTAEVRKQAATLSRIPALQKSLVNESAILIDTSWEDLMAWANRFAAEHVNLQTKDDDAILAKLKHGGAVFVGPYSPVAAGDYVAGPSHCLPTNTTARFSSGISAIEFLKRASVERYTKDGLAADADAIVTLANAEGLDGHAASVRVRQ